MLWFSPTRMADSSQWPSEDEFESGQLSLCARECSALRLACFAELAQVKANSSTRIIAIAKLALRNQRVRSQAAEICNLNSTHRSQYYKFVVHAIERFIRKTKRENRIAGLYLGERAIANGAGLSVFPVAHSRCSGPREQEDRRQGAGCLRSALCQEHRERLHQTGRFAFWPAGDRLLLSRAVPTAVLCCSAAGCQSARWMAQERMVS